MTILNNKNINNNKKKTTNPANTNPVGGNDLRYFNSTYLDYATITPFIKLRKQNHGAARSATRRDIARNSLQMCIFRNIIDMFFFAYFLASNQGSFRTSGETCLLVVYYVTCIQLFIAGNNEIPGSVLWDDSRGILADA